MEKEILDGRFSIRPIAVADNKTMASIIRNCLIEYGANKPGTVFTDPTTDDLFSLFNHHEPAVYYVVEDLSNKEVVGGCGIFPTPKLPPNTYELVKLYIRKEYRGLGIAKELMTLCEQDAKNWGVTQLYIESMPELKRAIIIYENTGYQYIQHSLGSSGHCGCNIFMLKKLTE